MPEPARDRTRWFACAVLPLVLAGTLPAQASPFLPLDDPRLPLIEHLIARGDIRDPSPLIRPFRRSDLVRALDEARLDSATTSGQVAGRLRRDFADRAAESWWAIAPRAGIQSFTHARRDLLQPGGRGTTRGYVEAELTAGFGPVVLATRVAGENRLKLDPDWAGSAAQTRKNVAYRFIEAYASAQFRWGAVQFGQFDRNWGPAGLPGAGISNYAYPRTDFSFELGPRALQFRVIATQLRDEADAEDEVVHRYFVAHRIDARLGKNLALALWETVIAAGRDLQFEPATLNPLFLFSFGDQFGRDSRRNSLIGGELHWRPARALLLEGEAVIDDLRLGSSNEAAGELPRPNRWAFTVAASGPLGAAAGWRASYTAASSLAFRTANPAENYTDGGVGIGRNFPDNGMFSFAVTVPVRGGWLVTPEANVLAQGEGRINQPFPTAEELSGTPEFLIGTVRTTWRIGLGLSGQPGPLGINAVGGFHHTTNAGHQPGRTRDRFEGRVFATLGFRSRHALPAP